MCTSLVGTAVRGECVCTSLVGTAVRGECECTSLVGMVQYVVSVYVSSGHGAVRGECVYVTSIIFLLCHWSFPCSSQQSPV